MRKRSNKWKKIRSLSVLVISLVLLIAGAGALWIATLKMPDLNAFENRKVAQSTKIYDRTGNILLYDVNTDTKRTVVPLAEISPLIQKATIAIEDVDFYTHSGIRPTAIMRAFVVNILAGGVAQGGSTITQQVVKNALLTQDKTITRKIKEVVLAIRLEKIMSKDKILETYLNENAYGGTLYGVEEASQAFFGKKSSDVSLGEAAYIAAIPQAPTYYSPYGTHRDALDARQKLVLERMKSLNMITETEYKDASKEKVTFASRNSVGIKAPHFVMMVKDYVTEKLGDEAVNTGGLKIITTLDYEMQKKMEDVVARFGPNMATEFNASNTAMIAIDPKTGDILALVGSRDYFDPSIDGNYNIALAKRQPGSTFKPFVYATAFKKGYTPETILFDVKTEFSTLCNPDGTPKNSSDNPEKVCYDPEDYDSSWWGPMTIKYALAQSRNIPAIKALYLAGLNDSIQTAKDMGITTLNDPNRYGLTLVLGGGEVTLLDLTSAYGVFANDGVRNPYRSVLKVEDHNSSTLIETSLSPSQVIPAEIARQISDILSDDKIRMSGMRSITDPVGRQVAMKTGTTNDWRDVWAVGYTPSLVVGAWAGKNDNTPLVHKVAGMVITPIWGAFMSQTARNFPAENFGTPPQNDNQNKPVLHGVWQGGISYWIDTISNKLATEYTPNETKKEFVFNNVHTILHWVNKDDPNGAVPSNPSSDPQYINWEYGVRKWLDGYKMSNPTFKEDTITNIPTDKDDIHTPEKSPTVRFASPSNGSRIIPSSPLNIQLNVTGGNSPLKTDVFINGKFLLTNDSSPTNFTIVPNDAGNIQNASNTISIIFYDRVYNKAQASVNFSI